MILKYRDWFYNDEWSDNQEKAESSSFENFCD